jgi:hypothetical protein
MSDDGGHIGGTASKHLLMRMAAEAFSAGD